MPRNMSFSITTQQARDKSKTVTRRLGWWFLKSGDCVRQVEKSQGLRKGEKVKWIHLIRISDARPEPLRRMIDDPTYGKAECILEGFPDMSPEAFVEMFCRHNGCEPDESINRIKFDYIEG
jgi:hypothetical protein